MGNTNNIFPKGEKAAAEVFAGTAFVNIVLLLENANIAGGVAGAEPPQRG
jgi:hypothetical protein